MRRTGSRDSLFGCCVDYDLCGAPVLPSPLGPVLHSVRRAGALPASCCVPVPTWRCNRARLRSHAWRPDPAPHVWRVPRRNDAIPVVHSLVMRTDGAAWLALEWYLFQFARMRYSLKHCVTLCWTSDTVPAYELPAGLWFAM